MIISASYKTDIPAFYTPWFANRLKEGYCKMVNPYNKEIVYISLRPLDVQGFVFWSRNYQPFINQGILDGIAQPFICHMSVMNYPRQLDKATIHVEKAVSQIHELAGRYGPRCVVWRYDPIVLSEMTPFNWHLENFEKIASSLASSVDEVIVSFVQLYRKTQRNLKIAGLEIEDPSLHVKQELLLRFHEIAKQYGIVLSLCAQPELRLDPILESACIDAQRLEDVGGSVLTVGKKPHRKECGCVSSRDIGAYDSCPHGCVYCYAVKNNDVAKSRYHRHNPDSPFLFDDHVKSQNKVRQLSLFDGKN